MRGLSVRASDEDLPAGEPESCQLRPVEGSFAEQYLKDFYGKAMDKQLAEIYDERLWLAKLNLIRQGNAIIIDSVEPSPFHQYVYNAQQLMTLRELEEFYPQQNRVPVPSRTMGEQLLPGEPRIQEENRQGRMACGVFDLGLGLDYSTREAVFSDEIMHGLGKGAVYVDVGVEYIRAADGSHEESSAVYLGDMSIFEQESSQKEEDRVYKISTAVKVLPDRGTFVVGVRLGDVSGLISLRIRWYAWRMGETSKQVRSDEGGQRYMLVKPDTVVVPPKGTAHITPVFVNMPTEPCRYSLVDARGGSIDNNGVYTAPAAEGVYEIRIEAISDPTVFTHAFAVVTQKKKES